MSHWIFGYGSLIWRPDFAYIDRQPARVHGWIRRFWQGSHDHRGTPEAPGRVVTLLPESTSYCDGMAYLIEDHIKADVFDQLDYREKNGYERHSIELDFRSGNSAQGLVYIAAENNEAFLGPAPLATIAQQILLSSGPSGHNTDYLLELATALRSIEAQDDHVFDLERTVLEQLS